MKARRPWNENRRWRNPSLIWNSPQHPNRAHAGTHERNQTNKSPVWTHHPTSDSLKNHTSYDKEFDANRKQLEENINHAIMQMVAEMLCWANLLNSIVETICGAGKQSWYDLLASVVEHIYWSQFMTRSVATTSWNQLLRRYDLLRSHVKIIRWSQLLIMRGFDLLRSSVEILCPASR